MDIRDEFLGKCTDFCIINITKIDDNGTQETIDSASEQVGGVATKKAKLRTGSAFEVVPEKKKRGKAVPWNKRDEFENLGVYEASDCFQDLKANWRVNATKTNKTEITKEFFCKFSSKKKVGFNCPKKAKVVFTAHGSVEVYESEGDHNDQMIENNERIYNDWSDKKEDLKGMLKIDVTTRNLKKKLTDDGKLQDNVTRASFYSAVNRAKVSVNKALVPITKHDLKNLLNTFNEDKDKQEIELLKFDYTDETTENDFKFQAIFSNKSLIELIPSINCLAVDTTYQTNVDNFHVAIAGNQDATGRFIGIALMLCSHEDTASYKFLFEWIDGLTTNFPKALMADAAPSITKALKEVAPDCIRLHCFFHLLKNVKDRLAKIRNMAQCVYDNLLEDISILQQYSLDEESFQCMSDLLIRYW